MISLALAAEDGLGEWVVRHVTDRLLLEFERIGIEVSTLEHFRRWLRFDGHDRLPFTRVHELCRHRFGPNFRLSGHFGGEPGAADALGFRKLFALLRDLDDPPDIVVVARDIDHQDDRRLGFVQAANEARERGCPFAIVGALAQPEVEAWLLAAWTPENEAETSRLADLRRDLGMDPVARSHDLTSTTPRGKRDVKKVLERLTRLGRAAHERFASVSLADLRGRGRGNGLADFVARHDAALRHRLGLPPPPA